MAKNKPQKNNQIEFNFKPNINKHTVVKDKDINKSNLKFFDKLNTTETLGNDIKNDILAINKLHITNNNNDNNIITDNNNKYKDIINKKIEEDIFIEDANLSEKMESEDLENENKMKSLKINECYDYSNVNNILEIICNDFYVSIPITEDINNTKNDLIEPNNNDNLLDFICNNKYNSSGFRIVHDDTNNIKSAKLLIYDNDEIYLDINGHKFLLEQGCPIINKEILIAADSNNQEYTVFDDINTNLLGINES